MIDNVETMDGILRFFLGFETVARQKVSLEDTLLCRDQRHYQMLGHKEVVQVESAKNASMGHRMSYVHVVDCLYGVDVVLLAPHHQQLQVFRLHPH